MGKIVNLGIDKLKKIGILLIWLSPISNGLIRISFFVSLAISTLKNAAF
jgi:hypothetical protein